VADLSILDIEIQGLDNDTEVTSPFGKGIVKMCTLTRMALT
jgi:hypothetical protein